jgi:hypothetical protein
MRGKGVTVSQLLCDEARCDDVEEELACSTREFCAGFAAFANLDLANLDPRLGRTKPPVRQRARVSPRR